MFFVVVFCINTQTDQNRANRIYFNDEKKNMDLVEKIFVSGVCGPLVHVSTLLVIRNGLS